jgi:hypothetical protein
VRIKITFNKHHYHSLEISSSGVIGIAIVGTVLANELSKYLVIYAPRLPADILLAVRRNVSVIFTLPTDQQEAVVHAYTQALNNVFLIGVLVGALASFSALYVTFPFLPDV